MPISVQKYLDLLNIASKRGKNINVNKKYGHINDKGAMNQNGVFR